MVYRAVYLSCIDKYRITSYDTLEWNLCNNRANFCDQHVCMNIIFHNWSNCSDSANQIFFNPFRFVFFITFRFKHAYFKLFKLNLKCQIKIRRSKCYQCERSYCNNSWNNYIHVSCYCCGGWFYVPMKQVAHSPIQFAAITIVWNSFVPIDLVNIHGTRQGTLIYYKHTHHVQRK